MKLSKTLLVIPAASFLFAVAVGSGACGGDTVSGGPTVIGTAPAGVIIPGGYTWGEECDDDNTYIVLCNGDWAVCQDGYWGYATEDPVDEGFTVFDGGSGDDGGYRSADDGGSAGDGGDDGGGGDAGGGDGG
jgi:hypothetical protein